MNEGTQHPAEYYDNIASVYDSQRFYCRCGRALHEVEIGIATKLLGNSGRVLDLGTGTGRFSLAATRQSPVVAAVDASRMMILAASLKQAAVSPASRVSFIVADAASLPFPSESFDAVIAVKLLSHYREIDRFVSEMARVLKDGGRLIVDAPHGLAPIYRKLVRRPSINSYVDYSHPASEIAKSMQNHWIDVSRRVTYSILPSTLAHLMLCPHHKLISTTFLRRILETRTGFLSFLEGVKRE